MSCQVSWAKAAPAALSPQQPSCAGNRHSSCSSLGRVSLARISHTVTAEGCWGRVRAEFLPRDQGEHEQAALRTVCEGAGVARAAA